MIYITVALFMVLVVLFGCCFLAPFLGGVAHDMHVKPINDAIVRRNKERAKKYQSQTDLWSDIWDGRGGFEDKVYDSEYREKMEGVAGCVCFVVLTIICVVIFMAIFDL